jgi:5-hydroxyisourate hydrolase
VSTLSTHVLDSGTGRPAAGMSISLETSVVIDADAGPGWIRLGTGVTDPDGRLRTWGDLPIRPGIYRLGFDTGGWFAEQDRECFYPEVVITFTIKDDSHHHVPLLLAQFGYSTYRGS